MLKVIIPLGIVGAGLMIYSLIECIQTPRHRVRVLGKSAWLAVIVLVPIIGAGLWLAFGRGRMAAPGAAPKRPSAPDDDPNFLRNLEIQRMQKQREEELRRKEAELEARQKGQTPQKKPDDGAATDTPSDGSGAPGADKDGDGSRNGNGRPPRRPEDSAGDAAEDTDVDDPRST
ncbi:MULTISPECIES: PLD nuclease N-terminal domain-containing protein [Actinomycetes]|uniref:Cardiolipin synthase N-terminal domain-containing protein n=2 Tax=Actinomycetes TaxID=1760 RepID=A0ABP6LXY6_9MICC